MVLKLFILNEKKKKRHLSSTILPLAVGNEHPNQCCWFWSASVWAGAGGR